MKANIPEKIYIQPNAHDGWFESNPHSNIFVEYSYTDAFIEKAVRWLKSQDEMVGVSFEEDFIERFKAYMKGE